jgi:hypothetical protein
MALHHSITLLCNEKNDASIHPLIQDNFQQIVAQMQKMNACLNDVESTQQSLVTNQQQLTKRVECNETMITELQERLGTMATVNTTKSVAGKKNISNMHPGLKVSSCLPSCCLVLKTLAHHTANIL